MSSASAQKTWRCTWSLRTDEWNVDTISAVACSLMAVMATSVCVCVGGEASQNMRDLVSFLSSWWFPRVTEGRFLPRQHGVLLSG